MAIDFSSLDQANSGDSPYQLVGRPTEQFASLPVQYRWEASRRHPYYQLCWSEAANAAPFEQFLAQMRANQDLLGLVRQFAVAILGKIGFWGPPPSPDTTFNKLSQGILSQPWMRGAVFPLSYRALIAITLDSLSQKTLLEVGQSFLIAANAENENHELSPKIVALQSLNGNKAADLDAIPNSPLFAINPYTSERDVVSAMRVILGKLKEMHSIPNRRDRSPKYETYLKVWDLREGWQNGHYDSSKEKKLVDIAKRLKLSMATAHNHYRSAFELVTGHRYSPELWFAIMGAYKLNLLALDGSGLSLKRPRVKRSKSKIPRGKQVAIETAGHPTTQKSGYGMEELYADIRGLIDQGASNEQIAVELGLKLDPESYLPRIREMLSNSPNAKLPARKK